MKLTKIAAWLRDYLTLGGTPVNATTQGSSLAIFPPGMTPDDSALFGLIGFMANSEAVDNDLIAVAGGAATAVTLTAAAMIQNFINFSSTAGGGITATTPTAAQIIAALPPTIPPGGFNYSVFFINDNGGQTVTLTAGSGVTILGTATIATNTTRQFLICVNTNANTVTIINIGTQNL